MIESSPLIIAIRIGLLLFVGFMMARNMLQTWRNYRAATDWPQLKGKAVKSDVVDAGIGSRRGFMGAHTWRVQYKYRVKGKTYISKPQMPFPNTSKGNAQMMQQRLPVGSTVALRYNPENPAESVLATSRNGAMAQLILRIVVYSVAIGVLVWATITY